VHQLDPMHVDINAAVDELEAFRGEVARRGLDAEGIPVTVLLPDGSRYQHQGKVKAADLAVDPGTGSFRLRVVVPNPDLRLLPGMYVRTIAEVGVRQDAVLAPQRGVTRDPKGNATAMVVQPDGTVAARQLKATRTIGDQWLVESGLQAGDRVIVSGLQKVQPGMPATAVEAGSAAANQAAAPAQQPAAAAAPAQDGGEQ